MNTTLLLNANEGVYYEVRNILLKVREYKKSQSIPINAQFSKVYQFVVQIDLQYDITQLLEQILELQETDEFIQIAFINFYAKLFTCCHEVDSYDWLTPTLILKIFETTYRSDAQYQPVYYEKRLKLLRNAFDLPLQFLTLEVVQAMWTIIKQTEVHQNLLVKELARDTMNQSVKKLINNHWNQLQGHTIQFILKELVGDVENQVVLYTQDPIKNYEAVRLMEYPFSIIQFILKKYSKAPTNDVFKQFILEDVIFLIYQMSQLDHQVIINQVLDSFRYLIVMSINNQFQDVLETRTLFGQIILHQLQRQTKKLSTLNLIEQGGMFLGELDVALLLNFLKVFFSQPKVVLHVYEKCDFNPIQTPLFSLLLQGIFEVQPLHNIFTQSYRELVGVSSASIQDLLVIVFKCSQLRKTNNDSKGKKEYEIIKQKIQDFVTVFNGDPDQQLGPRMAIQQIKLDTDEAKHHFVQFIKQSSLLSEHMTVEILGYHKEKYIKIMEGYVSSFNFRGLSVVEGLRLLLSNFLLYGEAQMIERVLNQFTITYVEQNVDSPLFKDTDSTYTFTYALILLNTDLYNKTVIKRMTVEDFLRQCQKINAGDNLPETYVRDSYDSIQKDSIKCIRDFANSKHLTKFVWSKYLEHKDEVTLALQESLTLFGQVDLEAIKSECLEEQLAELMLHQVTKNIEQMVVQYGQDGLEDLTNFLQNVLQICIDNDKMENAQTILSCMYDQVFSKQATISPRVNLQENPAFQIVTTDLHVHLYTCFVISKFMLPYLTFQDHYSTPYNEKDFSTVILLIRNTVMFRHYIQTETLAVDCRRILIKIKTNNKFNKKNLGTNSGIFSLFQKFLQQEDHDDDESDDGTLRELKDLDSQLNGFKDPNLLLLIIKQTKYLNPASLNGFLNQLLGQICSLNTLDSEVILFSQILHLAVEVLRINDDRIVGFWPQVTAILSLNYEENRISLQREGLVTPPVEHLIKMEFKKRRNRRLIEGFCKFTLLKLSIEVLHIGETLGDHEWCFQQGLAYLEGQSLEILVEFLREIACYVKTNKLEGAKVDTLRKAYTLLKQIYNVLEKRILDKNDAKIIFDQTQEAFEDLLIKSHSEKDTFEILKEQVSFIGTMVAQKDIAKISDAFQAKNLANILMNYDLYIQTSFEGQSINPQESNDFLLQVLNLSCGLSKEHIQKALTMVQKVTFNYSYDAITEDQLKYLIDKIISLQPNVVLIKNEILMENYNQMKETMLCIWRDEKKFPVTPQMESQLQLKL